MKIYLASKFANATLMRDHRIDLAALGHTVTSRWIDSSGDDSHYTASDWHADAVQCIEDVKACDVLVHCIPDDHGGRGGRHVEFGMALALGKGLIIVGERELVFHWLPHVASFPTWDAFLAWLSEG